MSQLRQISNLNLPDGKERRKLSTEERKKPKFNSKGLEAIIELSQFHVQCMIITSIEKNL